MNTKKRFRKKKIKKKRFWKKKISKKKFRKKNIKKKIEKKNKKIRLPKILTDYFEKPKILNFKVDCAVLSVRFFG